MFYFISLFHKTITKLNNNPCKNRVFAKALRRRKIKSDIMTNTLTNRQILNSVLSGSTIEFVWNRIGNPSWTSEKYIPATKGNGYIRSQVDSQNWNYCDCCGNPAQQNGFDCNCDYDNESDYLNVSNHEMVEMVRKIRNNDKNVQIYIDGELVHEGINVGDIMIVGHKN